MILGLDIGSMAIAAVLLDYGGQIEKELQKLSKALNVNPDTPLAFTSSTRLIINGIKSIDIRTALKKLARKASKNIFTHSM